MEPITNDIWTRYNVLIVDDEFSNRFYLYSALESKGVKVFAATNGHDAVEICKLHPEIDMILLDLHMPGFSGYETFYEIKKNRPSIKVIAETADITQKNSIVEMGFDDYLFKPIRIKELIEMMEKHMTNSNL
jgi:CheY-like chemotaxis protein